MRENNPEISFPELREREPKIILTSAGLEPRISCMDVWRPMASQLSRQRNDSRGRGFQSRRGREKFSQGLISSPISFQRQRSEEHLRVFFQRLPLNFLKGPSQPHFCFCLHSRVWLSYFILIMSKRRKSLETTKDNQT